MNQVFICSFLILAVAGFLVEHTSAVNSKYNQIGEYLVARVQDGSRLEIEKLRELHNEESMKANKDDELIRLLDTIIALDLVQGPPEQSCNRFNHVIIKQSYELVDSNPLPDEQSPLDRLIMDRAIQHALECRSYYPTLYKQLKKQVPPEADRQVDVILSAVVQSHAPALNLKSARTCPKMFSKKTCITGSKELYSKFIKGRETISTQEDANAIVSTIQRKKVLGSSTQGSFQDNLLQPYLNDYLVESCRAYVHRLGPDLFEPATFDSMFFAEAPESKSGSKFDFYYSWSKFLLCKDVLANPGAILELYLSGRVHQ